jgi:hypothetical protein
VSSCACEVPVVRTIGQCGAHRSSWRDALLLSLVVAVPAAFILLAGYGAATLSHLTDEELVTRFLLHKSDFQALAHMLESDRERLISLGAESFEFADLVQAGADTAQIDGYKVHLAKIGATNFRYFPRSGNLFLPALRSSDNFTQTKKSYLYLNREAPQPLLHHQGYSSWRGPGIYFVTGDHRIEGRWFIHHDGIVVVAFAPY